MFVLKPLIPTVIFKKIIYVLLKTDRKQNSSKET